MKIVAHRGVWKKEDEKNTLESLKRALDMGWGIETDLRDYKGELVISHNIADEKCEKAEELFKYYFEHGHEESLALNVKADGIQPLLKKLLEKYQINNYFLFDMSIPEMVVNKREKLTFFTRHSDIEEKCVLYEDAQGVWLDSFYEENWLTEEILERHLKDGKKICIISPEIHGYDATDYWDLLKQPRYVVNDNVMLCTDVPVEAKEFLGL